MPKALVVSLGGSIDPILKSIETHRPDYLYFFSSQESNAREYPNVKKKLDELNILPKIESVIVDDTGDLVHCYEKALEIAVRIERQGISPEDTVVDYTGGTKTMSAALVLATVTKFTSFSYVGGRERTKEGLGVVVTGTEEIKTTLSPWRVLLVEDRKKIALFFNSYQFSASRDTARKLSSVLSGLDKAIYETLSDIIEGYRLWDSFGHGEALEILRKSQRKLSEHLRLKRDPFLLDFLESVGANLGFLAKTKGDKKAMAFDLFHNAKRRAEEGKYDDAVARLYRSLEMVGQIEFEREFRCSTSDVAVERIPASIREEIIRKHTSYDGKVKIPLYDSFLVLKEAGNELGAIFFRRKEEIERILSARNGSILAHGVTPVSMESFKGLSHILEDFLKNMGVDYRIEFPKLPWE